MPSVSIAPFSLDRKSAPERLGPSAARVIQNMETAGPGTVGIVARSTGYSRVAFESGQASAVIAMGRFLREDGTAILVWSTGGGVNVAQVRPGAEYAESDY